MANENKTKSFNYEGIDGKPVATKGDVYVGCKFRGKLWRFLEPGKDDTLAISCLKWKIKKANSKHRS